MNTKKGKKKMITHRQCNCGNIMYHQQQQCHQCGKKLGKGMFKDIKEYIDRNGIIQTGIHIGQKIGDVYNKLKEIKPFQKAAQFGIPYAQKIHDITGFGYGSNIKKLK